MGTHHARGYASLGGLCELHGVHDVDQGAAARVAKRFETRAYADLDALLVDVDVVSIASPSCFHVDHALRALDAGVHTLLEKPVAPCVSDALRLQAAAVHAPETVLQIGHIEHFNPAIRELRKLLATQPVVALDIQRLSPFDGRNSDVDVVRDLMLHDIHVVLSVAKSPLRRVQAVGRTVNSTDLHDYAVAHLIFDDGMIASLSASRVTEEKVRRLSATTAEAHVSVDYLRRTIDVCRWTRLETDASDDRAYRQESVVERIFVPQEEPLLAELSSFLACVRDARVPEVDLAMGVRCLEAADQIYAASQQETPIGVAA